MRMTRAAVLGALLLVLPAQADGDAVTVSDLVAEGEAWAGNTVTVEGELIGDYGRRADGSVWTQLNGDAYVSEPLADGGAAVGGNIGIGIRMDASLAASLDPPGRHGIRGPVVRVTGVWRWHDSRRQGESYLDVATLELIESGRPIRNGTDWASAALGLALLGSAAVLWLFGRRA